LIDFQNSFTAILSTKFATKTALYIPQYLEDAAELPRETTSVSKIAEIPKYSTRFYELILI